MKSTFVVIAATCLLSLSGAVPIVSAGILSSYSFPGLEGTGGARVESAEELFQSGMHSYTLGSFYASTSFFDRCLKKRPPEPLSDEAAYFLSLSYLGSGRFQKARRPLEKLIAKPVDEPLMSRCLIATGDCYRLEGNCGKAAGFYERAAERGGRFAALALDNQALCYDANGSPNEASLVRRKLTQRFPDSIDAAVARLALSRGAPGRGGDLSR